MNSRIVLVERVHAAKVIKVLTSRHSNVVNHNVNSIFENVTQIQGAYKKGKQAEF